jgi:hypothetical protein
LENIEHSTFNAQHPRKAPQREDWALDVECWLLNVHFEFNQTTFFTGTSGLTCAMGFSPFIAIEFSFSINLSVTDEFLRRHANVFGNLP